LDLFCGAGGAAMGLHRAGFDVVGMDIRPQPRYPFPFVQGDALAPPFRLSDFDLVWASPPCQANTPMSNRWRGKGGIADTRVDLLRETRIMLSEQAPHWILENVIGADMIAPFMLRGEMFGLSTSRPRLFETTFAVMLPQAARRKNAVAVYGKPDGRRLFTRKDGTELRAWTLEEGRSAMQMPWADESGLREAVPPAYSEHIGQYAMLALTSGHAANDSRATGRHDSEPQHLGDEGTEVGGGAAPEARP
jgi:DNA (cytosine-5)-methyltransferase 1